MNWKRLVSMTILAYLASKQVFAQPQASPADNTPAGNGMTIVDTGGSLKMVPAGSPDASQPAQTNSNVPTQQAAPPSGTPPAMNGNSPNASVQSNGASTNGGVNPPPGELQEPSNPDESMMPTMGPQDSVPEPAQGSVQN